MGIDKIKLKPQKETDKGISSKILNVNKCKLKCKDSNIKLKPNHASQSTNTQNARTI